MERWYQKYSIKRLPSLFSILDRKLKQFKIIQILDQLDEKIVKAQTTWSAKRKRSLRTFRLRSYLKSFGLWSILTSLSLTFGQIGNEQLPKIMPVDYHLELLALSHANEKRLSFANDQMINDAIELGKADTMSYVTIGRQFAKYNFPDLAYTAFYMAHLKDHKNIGANSDLQLNTGSRMEQNKMGGEIQDFDE